MEKQREQSVAAIRCLCGEVATAAFTTTAVAAAATGDAASVVANDAVAQLSAVYGEGPLLLSEIPESCLKNSSTSGGVILGIDEAGRGSVVGPMVYGMAFWHPLMEESSIPKDFGDSKQLTESQRDDLFERLLATPDIGFGVRVLPASEISRNMLRASPNYNLNQMSHDAAIGLIRSLMQSNRDLAIQTCYIDTVGNPQSYTRRLEQEFPGIEFIVESKADDKYAPCSAASIVAKVVRDRIMEHWTFTEPGLNRDDADDNAKTTTMSTNFGSGYPSDPVCQAWMKENWSAVFGFPDAVRFSWGPTKKLLTAQYPTVAKVTFAADDENDEAMDGDQDANKHQILLGKKRQQEQMSTFLATGSTSKAKRLPYFETKKLHCVMKL